MKLGRNKPCWCGSGKKFKKCHLDRDTQKPINEGVIHKQFNSFYTQKYCSIPDGMKCDCSGKIIKAHSISKSSSLKEIARNGHVLTTFEASASFKNGFEIKPKKIGIQKASTFTGFCSHHDKTIFKPIEDVDFSISEESCFLVAYRAVSRELFVKERSSGNLDLLKELDKGKSIDQQKEIQAEHKRLSINNNLSTSDLKFIKDKLDQMLIKSQYNGLKHLVFTLPEPPKVMTSAAAAPTFDFQGNKIQEFSQDPDEIPSYIIINSFSSQGIGYICLSWIDEHNSVGESFYKSLQQSDCIEGSLLAFIFTNIENNYLSDDWWNALDRSEKSYLMGLYSQGVIIPTYNDALRNAIDLKAFKIISTTKLGF